MKTHNHRYAPADKLSALLFVKSPVAAWAFLLCAIVALTSPLRAQTNLLMIDYQWADSVNGPWTKPPTSQTYVQPNGSILTLATNPQKYFRLTIGEIDFEDIQTPGVQVAHLRDETITIAEHHLQWLAMNFLGGSNGSSVEHAWANARLAPIALKVFDPAYRNGAEPAYIEFKIVSDFQPAEKRLNFSSAMKQLGQEY